MAAKLKNLMVDKVDFVDEGANQDADIKILKRNSEEGISKGKGSGKNSGNVFKKLFNFGKAAGMGQGEIDSAGKIQKGDAVSFNERFLEVQNRKIADEIWDICYALQASLCSILNDEDADTENAMQESITEFCTVIQECITQWSAGKESGIVKKSMDVTEEELDIMKYAASRLNDTLEKAAVTKKEVANSINNQKGEITEMIDKSKMTDAERAFYEDIEKRYGMNTGSDSDKGDTVFVNVPSEPTVAKSIPVENENVSEPQTDDIYKGLHPAVKAELEELKKFRESAENKELTDIAKKYAIIGKNPDELVPMFKNLKAAGGTAYNDMIAVLDQAVETVEKSGAFSEIGKSGNGSTDGGAWTEANAKAVELMKAKPNLTLNQAVDEVLMANPELAARCEKEE